MTYATLFVRKIPSDTTVTELKDFIDGGVPLLWRIRLGRKFRIVTVKILTIFDKRLMEKEFHGLITIEPEAIADTLIRRLHAKQFKGRRVGVRRFHTRSARKDRRHVGQGNETEDCSQNRRIRDRRRENLVVINESLLRTIGSAAFSRKLV